MNLAIHPKDIVEASDNPLLVSAEHRSRKPLGDVATILIGYPKAIHDLSSSSTVKHLSSRDVEDSSIPVPAIKEQRKSAAQILALSQLVGSSNGCPATIPTHLKKFRQSVLTIAQVQKTTQAILAKAFSGEL
jgi:hypothetical protein